MKVQAIIQARMTSTRLPGKVLKLVCGKPLLEHQIDRLRRSKRLDRIVVATTTRLEDSEIVNLCERLNVEVFRGSEHDVLSRYYGAARGLPDSLVVRLTSDCPLLDPEIVDEVIGKFVTSSGKYDYASNTIQRTYPRGMDTEVFSYPALSRAQAEAQDPYDREHVTPYLYRVLGSFRVLSITREPSAAQYRLTVDTPEDLELITRIFDDLYPSNPLFNLSDILQCLERHPSWTEINAQVQQKA